MSLLRSISSLTKARDAYPAQSPGTVPQGKSFLVDPLWIASSLRYKDKPWGLSYDVLRLVSQRDSVVAAILQTRLNQVSNFWRPARTDTEGRGFLVRQRDPKKHPTRQENKFAAEAELFFERCGNTERRRDRFHRFLKKFVRDTLVLDQATFEIVRDRLGRPAEFFCTDGASYRIMSSPDTAEESYVQLLQGRPAVQLSPDELAFCVRNPRTDLRVAGYGYAETEMILNIITSHLNAEDYNHRFFRCLHEDTLIGTKKGCYRIGDAYERFGGEEIEIWTGTGWSRARLRVSGVKQDAVTRLHSGLEIKSSPDHRFYIADRRTGEVGFVRQEDLRPGDWLLLSTGTVDGAGELPTGEFSPPNITPGQGYNSPPHGHSRYGNWRIDHIDEGMWELLGWLSGDGHCGTPTTQLFYHPEKEKDIHDRHLAVLEQYGVQGVRPDYGKDGTTIRIGNAAFRAWLAALGFTPPSVGRRIPWAVFAAPAQARGWFLRGRFSADGCTTRHITGYGTPTLAVADPAERQDLMLLLGTLGISCAEYRSGTNYGIRIRNVIRFKELVGYIQNYKNEFDRDPSTQNRFDKIHPSHQVLLAQKAVESVGYANLERDQQIYIHKVLRGDGTASRTTILRWLRAVGTEPPEWLRYEQVEVETTGETGTRSLMYDAEVFDADHRFSANGVIVHNSGAIPKGIVWSEGAEISAEMMEAFRRSWTSQVSGIMGAHRLAMVGLPQGSRLNYMDLQRGNTEMAFPQWLDYLINIATAVFQIDPAEVNFPNRGGQGNPNPLFQSSDEARLVHSTDKGLRPLLEFVADTLTERILWEMPNGADFTFEFRGIERSNAREEAALGEIESRYLKTVNELRAERDMAPIEGGEILLNPIYTQQRQQAQQAQQPTPETGNGQTAPEDEYPVTEFDGAGNLLGFPDVRAREELTYPSG